MSFLSKNSVKNLKITGGFAASAVIATLYAASRPQFDPPEHVGFPALSMGDQYLSTVQSGDVLFFNHPAYIEGKPMKWIYNQIMKWGNNKNDFEHMGVIVIHPKEKYPYVLEKGLFGQSIATPFEDRIAWSHAQDVMMRSLHLLRTPQFEQDAARFLHEELNNARNQKLTSRTSALTRTMLYFQQIASIIGLRYREWSKPMLADTQVKVVGNLSELVDNFYAPTTQQRELFEQTVQDTNRLASIRMIQQKQLPQNRITLFGDLVSSLRILRTTEQQVTAHLQAEKAQAKYLLDLQAWEHRQLRNKQENKSSLENQLKQAYAAGGDDKSTTDTPAPQPPPIVKTSLLDAKDLKLLLQRRDLLYHEFDRQFNVYRDLTIDTAKWNLLFNPTRENEIPAYPGCDLVARFYQHMRLFCTPKYPTVGPVDVQELFPPGIPVLEEKQRKDDTDLRMFDFTKAYEILSQWAPYSKEYKPHHWRSHHNLYLTQGQFGDEQLLVNNFNKPPLEYRSGDKLGIIGEKDRL